LSLVSIAWTIEAGEVWRWRGFKPDAVAGPRKKPERGCAKETRLRYQILLFVTGRCATSVLSDPHFRIVPVKSIEASERQGEAI
jgi:hypothetical protein